MRIQRVIVTAAAAAIVIIVGVCGVYGYFSDIVNVTNYIALGDVNIGLKEYEQKQGTEVLYSNNRTVLPGDVISKIPRIINYAQPCWVRARITYENDNTELEALSDRDLSGFSDEWIRKGEYYYYTEILEQGEAVTLFQKVSIPSEWTEVHAQQKLKVDIQADAIQAANFQPDFSAMSPWGNQEIELCVHEEDGTVISRNTKVALSVEFNGSAHKLIAVPDDFFANIQTAMPGDVFEDSVEISNTTEKPAEIFFHTGLVCQRDDRMEMLKLLKLTISMKGNVLYSGNLQADELKKEISLGVFDPGDEETMEFTVSVPENLKNTYALRDTVVRWYFTVYEEDVPVSLTPTPSPGSGILTVTPAVPQNTTGTVSPVRTGDETPIRLFVLLAVISVLTGAVIFVIKKTGGRKL